MALNSVLNLCSRINSTLFRSSVPRYISTSPFLRLKEIVEKEDGKKLVIEGMFVESPRAPYLLSTAHDKSSCPVCSTNLDIKHTDVLILSQFVRSDGCMLPRRVTGLCRLQQKRISKMVAMAQKAGLMSNLTPSTSKKDPTKRKQWKRYKTYFDETTIRPPRAMKLREGVKISDIVK